MYMNRGIPPVPNRGVRGSTRIPRRQSGEVEQSGVQPRPEPDPHDIPTWLRRSSVTLIDRTDLQESNGSSYRPRPCAWRPQNLLHVCTYHKLHDKDVRAVGAEAPHAAPLPTMGTIVDAILGRTGGTGHTLHHHGQAASVAPAGAIVTRSRAR